MEGGSCVRPYIEPDTDPPTMSEQEETPRPRKRRRKRVRRRSVDSDADDSSPIPGPDVREVGAGEFAVLTVDRDSGETVVHRFQTRREAREQFRKNIAHDAPLVDVGEEVN